MIQKILPSPFIKLDLVISVKVTGSFVTEGACILLRLFVISYKVTEELEHKNSKRMIWFIRTRDVNYLHRETKKSKHKEVAGQATVNHKNDQAIIFSQFYTTKNFMSNQTHTTNGKRNVTTKQRWSGWWWSICRWWSNQSDKRRNTRILYYGIKLWKLNCGISDESHLLCGDNLVVERVQRIITSWCKTATSVS